MGETTESTTGLSDGELVLRTRSGDRGAYAELWRRHSGAGLRAARQFTWLDADDLVSEAFVRIYRLVLAGGGPMGAFRPYLYTAIRNLARSWGSARHEVAVEDITLFEPEPDPEDPTTAALDRSLTVTAFRTLPPRWQAVLWYTEVEGMDPHEVAPLLGLSANGVAALSYRAREGLRRAWIQAHIADATGPAECRWVAMHFGSAARRALTPRDDERMSRHLATCAHCAILNEEVTEVSSHLSLVLIPLVLGGVAGGTFLASLGAGSVAVAASIPALPAALATGAGTSVAASSALAPAAVVTLAMALTIGGSVALVQPMPPETAPPPTTVLDPQPTAARSSSAAPAPVTTDDLPPELASTGGDPVELVDEVLGSLTGGAPPAGHTAPGGVVGIDLSLTGSGTPGAHLSLQAAGQVYATTTVRADGTFTIAATAIPSDLGSLQLVQVVDRSYLGGLVEGGLLGGVLGELDALIDQLIRPLVLTSGGSGVAIVLVD